MPLNEQPPRLDNSTGSSHFLRSIFTVVAGIALLVAGFIFSLLILSVAAVVALMVWAWFWWKTRALRSHLSAQMEQMQREQQRRAQDGATKEGVTIEGEVIREDAGHQ